MRLLGLLALLFWDVTDVAGRQKTSRGAAEPVGTDLVRERILSKIQELVTEIGHPEWQYLAKRKAGLDGQLVLEFKALSERIEAYKAPQLPDSVLSRIWIWSVIGLETATIDNAWILFRKSQTRADPAVYGESWEKVAEIVLRRPKQTETTSTSIMDSLHNLQDMIWDKADGHKHIFKIVKEEAEDQKCEAEMSPQQLLHNLFSILQMSQLKAYTMIQFSWLLLRVHNKGNFTTEADMLRQNYLERMAQQAIAVKESMNEAEATYWKCDPTTHDEGKTYAQLTKVLQGFIVNEVDLNSEITCREDCQFYKYTKQYTCYKDNYCNQQPWCNGNIVGCQFVDSDMMVCQAPLTSKRRYDWIEYENGRTLGPKKSCKRQVNSVDSWWRYLFWHCSYCFCYCDDSKHSGTDRFFNLRPVVSDKGSNKVVTGVRFIKFNRIIHLQIQEGELLPLGGINETTMEWKPVDPYKIDDEGVTVGIDYHMLTWESRALDLDDVKVPRDSVVTGVKFRRVGGHLNLEVEAAEFNFTDGKLLHSGNKSSWLSNDKTDVSPETPRTKLELGQADIPTRSAGQSLPDSNPEQFIEFSPTDLELDAGQTTIPFLDTQNVAPRPPTPISGVGIYHKGRQFSGGFIAPRIFTYNFADHIVDHFPEINDADYVN